MKLNGKTLVITGAASGIGRALVMEAVRRGCSVAMADLDFEGVSDTCREAEALGRDSTRVTAHELDVASLDNWRRFRDEASRDHETLDGIINNAGITFAGTIEDTGYEKFEALMSVNFMGMVYGSKEFLPLLESRPSAAIVNVSSLFGLIPAKSHAAYCSSKFAIRGFTETLAIELADTNISVSSVHPGHIGTDIVTNAHKRGDVVQDDYPPEYIETYAREFKKRGLSPAKAAEIILNGLEKQSEQILVGRDAQMTLLLKRLAPRPLNTVLSRFIG